MTYRTTTIRVCTKQYFSPAWGYPRDRCGNLQSHDIREYATVPFTPHNRALRVMGRYENRGKTNHWAYRVAQRIALSFLMTKDGWNRLNQDKPLDIHG